VAPTAAGLPILYYPLFLIENVLHLLQGHVQMLGNYGRVYEFLIVCHRSAVQSIYKQACEIDHPGIFLFLHEYDMGDTTETLITVIGTTWRPPQRETVRLLARNVPPRFQCKDCGVAASLICQECLFEDEYPFYCSDCAQKHKHEEEMMLPVTNSPRMGVCGCCGELDTYEFVSLEQRAKTK